jgi:hypothetical protein
LFSLGKIDTVLANNYTRKTGKTDKQIAKLMDAETWFTAQEALDAGFIDELVEMVDAKNCSENASISLTFALYFSINSFNIFSFLF